MERLNPRRWFFYALDTVPQGEDGPLTYRWAQRAIAYQAFPAFIEGRIPLDGWEDIVRSASAMSGEPSVDHGSAIIDDTDALIRAALAQYPTKWWLKRQGHFLLLSDYAIRTGLLPPRVLLCGRCSDLQLQDDRKARIEIQDVLARFLDREYPQHDLGDAYPYLFENPETTDEETNPGLQIPKTLRDQPIPIYMGPHVETRSDPLTGLVVQQRMCPVFFMGFLAGNFGDSPADAGEFPPELADLLSPFGPEEHYGNWGELAVCLGEEEIPDVSVSNLLENPVPVILTDDRYGVDVMSPGRPATWPFASKSVLRNGYRLTVIYARGPVLWQHITGMCPINVDVCGWPSAIDGKPIDQAGFAWQAFMTEHVLAHDGQGYTAGPQVEHVMFDPTVDIDRSMIWTSKIQAWQAMTALRLGNAKGYPISMGLVQKTPLREIRRVFNVSFDTFDAKNAAGQAFIFGIDDLALPTAGVPVRERIELLNLPAPTLDHASMENWIDYTVGRDPKTGGPRTIPLEVHSQEAIEANRNEIQKVNGIRDLAYCADDATAADVMARRLMRLKQAPRLQQLPLRTDGVDLEIGDQVRVSHRHGIGPKDVGYQDRPMVILQHVMRGDYVTVEALDVGDILGATSVWGPDSLPDHAPDGTPEERAKYWIWTNDDGTLPSGGFGSRWR